MIVWILFALLYVAPMLFLSGHAVVACFSKRVSEYTTIETRGDAFMVFIVGLIPLYNLWLVAYVTYETYVSDWWREAKRDYLHRLLHE